MTKKETAELLLAMAAYSESLYLTCTHDERHDGRLCGEIDALRKAARILTDKAYAATMADIYIA